MTSIRTNCPRCGEVEMEASLVLLTIHGSSGEGTYSFVCPVCEEVIEKPADRKIVTLLRSAGVETTNGPAWSEVDEARPDGPPFTLDDVIDFHFLLRRDDWLARLMASAE
jgi:predicted RNA-binding Zn-ribbon protein involved in translation (DUF1610 family)